MKPSEKLASLEKYAQNIRDRLATNYYPKRNNSAFLKLDLQKTEKKIAELKLAAGAV